MQYQVQPVQAERHRRMRTPAERIATDLKQGRLRDIAPKIARLSNEDRHAVAQVVFDALDEVVLYDALSPRRRWMITALQYLAPPEAGDLLIKALLQSINMTDCCGCTQNRIIRALGAIRPIDAVSPLVQVIREERNPGHKQLAAVCIEKILKAHGERACGLVRQEVPHLLDTLKQLKAARRNTKPQTPPRPWHHIAGSPGWFKAMDRAVKAVERLLRRAGNTFEKK